MTTIDQPIISTTVPPGDPPAGPAPPPPRPRAVLRVAIEVYTGKDHRHHLVIATAGDAGEVLFQGWYGSRRAAVRAGREWARLNGYDLEEEG